MQSKKRKIRRRAPAPPAESEPGPAQPLEADLAHRVLETVPNILYVYDLKTGRSVFQNRSFGEFLGLDGATGTELDAWKALLHPDDAPNFDLHRTHLQSIRPGQTLSWEFRIRDSTGAWRWFMAKDVLIQSEADGTPHLIVGSASDVTEQKQAEENKDLLLEEIRHRTRNLTTLIDAIARQSLPKNAPAVEAYYKTYIARLRALFAAVELVFASKSRVADLRAVFRSALEPFEDGLGPQRIALGGPPVRAPEEIAGGIALAIHELATNATKYGGLSRAGGTVALHWTSEPRGDHIHTVVIWKERGGPLVSAPSREGFGTRVIRHAASRARDGKVALVFEPDGLRCTIAFSIGALGGMAANSE